jgi:hypothetical protein
MKTMNDANVRFLSVNDLAQETGESVGVWRKRILLKLIPFFRFGRNVRVQREDFEAFCASRLVK